MVDIKKGADWDFPVTTREADSDLRDAQKSRRLTTKSSRMSGSRVERPSIIPDITEPRSSFAVFEARAAIAIARRRFMDKPIDLTDRKVNWRGGYPIQNP